MLARRAEELRSRIDEMDRRTRERARAGQYEARAQQLERPSLDLDRLAATLRMLRAHGVEPTLDAGLIAALHEHAATLRARYDADPASITAPDGDLRFSFWQPLQNLPAQLAEALRQAWMRSVEAALPPDQPELLAVMERVPGFAVQVGAIRSEYAAAKAIEAQLPVGEEDFAKVDRIASDLRAKWTGLSGTGIPDDVLDFLRAATSQGAIRAQFTQKVEDWLNAHGLGANVRIALIGGIGR